MLAFGAPLQAANELAVLFWLKALIREVVRRASAGSPCHPIEGRILEAGFSCKTSFLNKYDNFAR